MAHHSVRDCFYRSRNLIIMIYGCMLGSKRTAQLLSGHCHRQPCKYILLSAVGFISSGLIPFETYYIRLHIQHKGTEVEFTHAATRSSS